jgi:hypothetical protein
LSDAWYYTTSGQPVGPISLDELRAALRHLPDSTQVGVWREGFPGWQRAAEVPELSGRPAPPSGETALTPARPAPLEARPWWRSRIAIAGIAALVVVLLGAGVIAMVGRQGAPDSPAAPAARAPTPQTAAEAPLQGQQKAVDDLKSQLPKRVDRHTTLIAAALEGRTIVYTLRLDLTKADISESEVQAKIRPIVLKAACADWDLTASLFSGASYRYVYLYKTGENAGVVTVKKGDC